MSLGSTDIRTDIADTSYVSGVVSVGTTQVEAKVGATRLTDREFIILYNDGSATVYLGPTGVTTSGSTKGMPLVALQTATIPIGNLALYMIAASGTVNIIVQEMA